MTDLQGMQGTAKQEKVVEEGTQGAAQRENFVGRMLRDGEYHVQRLLGYGGMGKVYLVTHTSLNISLALKQAKGDQPLPESVIAELDYILQGGDTTRYKAHENDFPGSGGIYTDRFLREALLLARLQHPAIPTLYDYFFEDGYWYLVMDYIPGPTLRAYLHQHGVLSSLEALHYALLLCDVLDYLHRQNPPIIFRDLKPSNIILTSEGGLMLVDFGIARYFKSRSGQGNDANDFGSPGYASPEQYQDEGLSDARSDLYSLGVILHEMLSGKHPTGLHSLLDTALQSDLDISPVLGGLVKLATRAEPMHRFQSAHTFYLALERAYQIEERRAYQRQFLKADEQPANKTEAEEAVIPEKYEQESEPSGAESPVAEPAPDGLSLIHNLERRQQTREALMHARQERLAQETLEIQLASVDESLKRRSSIPLSQTFTHPVVEEEIVLPVASPLTRDRGVSRIVRGSFFLALLLFLIMASLLIYMRGTPQQTMITQSVQLLPTPTSVPASDIPAITPAPGPLWQALPSLPATEADNSAVYAEVHGRAYIYMNGGYHEPKTASYDRSLYRYDIEAAHWEIVISNQFPGMLNNSAVQDAQGHIFFTAGYSTDTYSVSSLFYMYQLENGTLRQIQPSAPIQMGFGGSMITDQQGHLFLTQGFMQGGNPQVQAGTGWYRYDITRSQWHQLAPLPVGLGYVELALDEQGGILMLGGSKDAGQQMQTDSIYRYDIANNSWTQTTFKLPQTLSGTESCEVWPGQMVVVGGYDVKRNRGIDHAWLFDIHTMHWTPLPALPVGGSVLGAAACDEMGHVFLERGANDPNAPTRDFWELTVPFEATRNE